MDWWWSRFEKGLAVTSMWWEARLSDTHLTMMNALRGDISGDELCSRDVPVPDNKSLGCCWCNSLPTMINPLMNGWFWWLWGSCWPAPPSWTLMEVPYPPIDWSVSYFLVFITASASFGVYDSCSFLLIPMYRLLVLMARRELIIFCYI